MASECETTMLKPYAKEILGSHKPKNDILWGTMIEIPRACLTAEVIGKETEFFSFGTNDLTQMTYGYSRDDVEGKFLAKYIDEIDPPIMKSNPFETIDIDGVGRLIEIAVKEGRKGRADAHNGQHLKIGICGETGGDPSSIIFLHKIGLDYVSCSPFRIPVARVAAAHAAILAKKG